MSFPSRLVLDTVVLCALALAAMAVGWSVAPALVGWTCERAGVAELHVTGPSDVAWAYGEIALALALPALVAWIAGLVHLALARRPAPPWAPAVWLVLDLACVALGVAWQAHVVAAGTAALAGLTELTPMLTIGGLGLGAAGLRLGLVGGLVEWALTAWIARRRAVASGPPSAGT